MTRTLFLVFSVTMGLSTGALAKGKGLTPKRLPASAKYCSINFGVDGATGKSIPSKTSGKQARAVFTAMGGKSDVLDFDDGKTYEVMIRQDMFGIVGAADIVTIKGNQGSFSGDPAAKIYSMMKVAEIERMGGSSKSVENLTCNAGFGSRMQKFYECVVSNANTWCN